MINIAELRVGDKVCYQPSFYPKEKWENGIVKQIPIHNNSFVRVVYKCAGNWENFQDYTSEMTGIQDLTIGWKH